MGFKIFFFFFIDFCLCGLNKTNKQTEKDPPPPPKKKRKKKRKKKKKEVRTPHRKRNRSMELDYLVALVVRAFALRGADPGFNSRFLRGDFSGLSHTSDFDFVPAVATLPGTRRCRVSTGTGWPGVSILWLGETESLMCNFCLSVAAGTNICADPVPEIY